MKINIPILDDEDRYPTRTNGKGRYRKTSKFLYMVLIILTFGVFLTFMNIYELRQLQNDHMTGPMVEGHYENYKQPVVWVEAKNIGSGYLNHVLRVFERLGYVRGTRRSHWDIMWSHDYPFPAFSELKDLLPHQKVNKFPGSGWITNKGSLSTSPLKHIPKAFKIPSEKSNLLNYAARHPNVRWVQKSNNHRGIRIKSLNELDLNSGNTFVQQYVDDPFLIDGRRFDIGIYTTLMSIDPLRVYIYEGDWLIRFCPEVYYPFDPSNLDKYVVGDDYMPTWKMPSLLKTYSEMKYTHKETLLAHLRKIGKDDKKLVSDLEESIREVYLDKEPRLIESVVNYKSSRNFFEMVRFDFVLDKDLNIYLMEVNMSPNLSSGHFPPNKLLYEGVVFNLLSLVGAALSVTKDFSKSSEDSMNMQASDGDIAVYADKCSRDPCSASCLQEECMLCLHCMKTEQKDILKSAYLEHMHKRSWKRVFPKSTTPEQAIDSHKDTEILQMNEKNRWMTLWFHGKCLQSAAWCQ